MSGAASMFDRFSGVNGARNVLSSLMTQTIFQNSEEICNKISVYSVIARYSAGDILFNQDDPTNDLYFILAGSVSIYINGREINVRGAGQHVGEMSTIDIHARRSASVIAKTEVVTAKIAEPDFAAIANQYPSIWRVLAVELADRIRQRSATVLQRNARPRMFIGSSAEGLKIARTIQGGLQYDPVEVKPWSDSFFTASKATIEDLEREIKTIDFGVLVLTQDDTTESRGSVFKAPRDNVIFELGLIMGAIGRERTFFVQPRGLDLKIPSDLFGIKAITHSYDGAGDIAAALGPACEELRNIVSTLGSK